MENNGEKINIHERITRLEEKVNSILINHIPHLQKGMDEMNTKFWAIIILLIANLATVITNFKR